LTVCTTVANWSEASTSSKPRPVLDAPTIGLALAARWAKMTFVHKILCAATIQGL
jgi:hypothetical protein